jgi:hypothetical protein
MIDSARAFRDVLCCCVDKPVDKIGVALCSERRRLWGTLPGQKLSRHASQASLGSQCFQGPRGG